MSTYNPEIQPNAGEWLSLHEQYRIDVAEEHHQLAKIKVPNLTVHAVVHVVVENQIAEGHQPTVTTVERLTREGLSRHEAIHAVGSLVAEHIFTAMQKNANMDKAQARFDAGVERLSAKQWKRYCGK